MVKSMLIDASHPEETRVLVVSGNRLEEFDYESASKTQLRGNIYLAKITRVEPSLQAAFVDYGGNRHGFLPFSEIHPDYYRIPVADRKALIAQEAALKGDAAEEELVEDGSNGPGHDGTEHELAAEPEDLETEDLETEDVETEDVETEDVRAGANGAENGEDGPIGTDAGVSDQVRAGDGDGEVQEISGAAGVDTVGGDEVDDAARRRARLLRKYKIQEVIKRRQVILVQVTKEERGNKGAALTSYLSLAGRYCVLMPNTGKGGGISRKISNSADRRRLKQIVEALDIPDGVAVIVRTAGSERTKAEIRRDYEYLLRLWGDIRETTLASTAPNLIYEEADLIKRALRDLYQSSVDEILVDGEDGYKHAKSFIKSLMPSHAKKVKLYNDPKIPLFYHFKMEDQIDAMHNATVQLKSGGYIVINMTEALVAIDVNSGKATRARHIEETAYKTNLEAAEEIARQLRLRDLAGLLVIDFIDMEEARHNRSVERKLKEAMRIDRARIQLGRISPFGILEMSRQRLRPSLFESSTTVCPNCNASGFVRTTESVALRILRALEDEGIRRGAGSLLVSAPPEAALHLLNHMRNRIVEIEQRYGFQVQVQTDAELLPPDYAVERLSQTAPAESEAPRAAAAEGEKVEHPRTRGRRQRKKAEEPAEPEDTAAAAGESAEDGAEDKPKRRRRRGKRGGRRRSRRREDEAAPPQVQEAAALPATQGEVTPAEADIPAGDGEAEAGPQEAPKDKPKRRRAARKPRIETETQPEPASENAQGAAAAEGVAAQPEIDAEAAIEAKPKHRGRTSTAKRAPRKRKTAAKTQAELSDPRAQPADIGADTPAPESPREPPAPSRVAPTPVAPAPMNPAPAAPKPAEPEPIAEGPAANGGESAANGEGPGNTVGHSRRAEEPEGLRRRGWWQRFN